MLDIKTDLEEEASGLRMIQEDILLAGNNSRIFEAGGWILKLMISSG